MARTFALILIAAILGAWLGFVVFGSDDDSATSELAASEHGHDGTTAGSVGERLAADPEAVRFCVGAALEPYEGAMVQMRASGPAEAAERMRLCVFETLIGHGDDATMADLESHRPRFEGCFGNLLNANPAAKSAAVDQVSTCVLSE